MNTLTRCTLLCFAALAALSCEKVSYGERTDSSSWLSAVPDDIPVSSLSIPGTHDAATATLNTAVIRQFAKTQVLSIPDQLAYGVRAFDMRPAVVGGKLEICHSKFDTKTSFASAVGAIVEHLDAYPSEFAIVVIRHEEEADDNSPEWGRLMHECISGLPSERVMTDFDPQMTVAQMRGRILFLSRQEYDGGPLGAYITGWYSGQDPQRQKAAGIGDGRLWIQDYYDPDGKDDKLQAIKGLMDAYAAGHDSGTWCINHTSGYLPGIFSAPDYGANAENVNAQTADWLGGLKGSAGIVMMDFAGASRYRRYSVGGDRLLGAVINHNPLKTKVSLRSGVEVDD